MRRTRLAYVLATWFGCGYVPLAPGTAGSLGAIPLYLLLRPLGPWAVVCASVVLLAVGLWAADVVVDASGQKDPQIVVVDEVVGMLLTLAAAPRGALAIGLGFVAFRVFDQFKPWPANVAEQRLKGGWGVMMDDVVAGLYGALLLRGLVWWRLL